MHASEGAERTDRAPGVMLSDELRPDELVPLVELAESLGYAELWLTDQRFWRDCYMGLTLAAQHSERIRLGPGVNDPFTRHPATIAMAIATLDELSNGRAQLGLGVGGSGIREMHLPAGRPVRALREAIELIRLMLTGEVVDYAGEIFHLDGGRLGFAPTNRDIPISVATHSPQVLRLCGRLANGVLLGNVATPAGIAAAVQAIREGERAAQRREGQVRLELRLEACIAEDEAAAMATMKRRFANRLIATYPRWDYLEALAIDVSPDLQTAALTKDPDAVGRCLADDAVFATALVGTADRVVGQLTGLLTTDIDRVTIRPYACQGQGLDTTMVAFAEQVWPVARQLTAPAG
jgi:5,10-methylenetetrahydromethanopterin reductase